MAIDIDSARTTSRLAAVANAVLRNATDLLRLPRPGPDEVMRPENLNDHLLRDIGLRRNEAHEAFESVRDRLPPF